MRFAFTMSSDEAWKLVGELGRTLELPAAAAVPEVG